MGEFALRYSGRPVDLPHGGRRLIAFLAVHDRPIGRSYAAGSLWPGVAPERATGCLRSTLWRLRQAGAPVVSCGAVSDLALEPSLAVDVLDLLRDAQSCGKRCAELTVLEERLSTDLLPDWYDAWLVAIRERLRLLRLQTLETLCDSFLEQGQPSRAVDIGLTAAAMEPLREAPRRTLIRAHLQEGNVAEALREYRRFAAVLHADLGIEPSPALRLLIDHALAARRARRPQTPTPAIGARRSRTAPSTSSSEAR